MILISLILVLILILILILMMIIIIRPDLAGRYERGAGCGGKAGKAARARFGTACEEKGP